MNCIHFVSCSHKGKTLDLHQENKLFLWSFPFSGRFRLFNTSFHVAFEEYCCKSFSVLKNPKSSTYINDCFCFFFINLKSVP